MAFMAVLESDLRALSAEARRRHPAVKDGAEHAILKVIISFSLVCLSLQSVHSKSNCNLFVVFSLQ